MKNIGEGYWNYNGCDVYLAEHPKLQGKYEIYKGCDFISRAYNLKEAKEIIIEKFGIVKSSIIIVVQLQRNETHRTTTTTRTDANKPRNFKYGT